jgi:hypothetical protein
MTSSLFTPLSLSSQNPVARGDSKLVFLHPHEQRLLVKVVYPAGKKARTSRVAWYQARSRIKSLRAFNRELQEFLVAEAHSNGHPNPLARVVGLVKTDLGLGMVVEKICRRDGQLAFTLSRLTREPHVYQKYLGLLAELVGEINRRHIVLGAFSSGNIVLEESATGTSRLVLIDGFGEDSLIPIYSFSKFANTQRNLRKHRKLIQKLIRKSENTATADVPV